MHDASAVAFAENEASLSPVSPGCHTYGEVSKYYI